MVGESLIQIFGVHQRCGTNFLRHVIALHEEVSSSLVHEDHLVAHSPHLFKWIESAFASSGGDETHFDREYLRSVVGSACENFLRGQIKTRYVCCKTPDTANLDKLHLLFPDSKVVLLVRDPRDVAESAMLSFGTPLESVAAKWVDGAEQISNFIRAANVRHKSLARFETLVTNTAAEALRILLDLGIGDAKYEYDKIPKLNVIGSSDLMKRGIPVHWTGVPKTPDFNPIGRWKSSWSAAEVARFLAMRGRCGKTVEETMVEFGYEK